MRQYEEILSKISPIFYKLIEYRDYFSESRFLIRSYLRQKDFPNVSELHLSPGNINYFYIVDIASLLPFIRKIGSKRIILLTTKDKVTEEVRHYIRLDEVIVNMILNKFSYNDEYISSFSGSLYRVDFETLFITLVGRSTYETIRRNIK